MSEREVVLDQPVVTDESAEAIRKLTERAEHAEAELAKLHSKPAAAKVNDGASSAAGDSSDGMEQLEADPMMAHLLKSLREGEDIGHYGRLTFCMVARHFLSRDEIVKELAQDKDFTAGKAEALLTQVEGHDYSPPKRERIVEWQSQQTFPILPSDDPDCGNVYRTLKFPDGLYKHIGEYQEEKVQAAGSGSAESLRE